MKGMSKKQKSCFLQLVTFENRGQNSPPYPTKAKDEIPVACVGRQVELTKSVLEVKTSDHIIEDVEISLVRGLGDNSRFLQKIFRDLSSYEATS